MIFLALMVTTIGIPNGLTNLPIYNPTPGQGIVECYTGANRNKEWVVQQWSNEKSLCLDISNSPQTPECTGSDLAQEADTSKFCLWDNDKKVLLNTNSYNMSYNGCFVHSDDLHIRIILEAIAPI